MKMHILSLLIVLFVLPTSFAKADVGLNVGLGVPFVSQYGLDLTMGQKWSFSASYNNLSLDAGSASVDLSMMQALINYHPFSGSFYLGVGFGQETLSVESTDILTGNSAKADVTASAALARLGWMWGKADGGLWFGMDLTFVSPSGGEVDVETTGFTASDSEYQDVKDAGEQFGKTAYTNITFARLGYLF